ncbi:Aste57867_13039 [Aphanomyces stellatus]|uniref:Aste57867_13039 protein n=1 Tax=Aphanomyces stellatus TaxID=120398 RepID=A0A485KXK9_9STRA|nr:hypothetical protein As57867_012991 [Aphanomyces stellatus]VFT89884.1 Aste57867_13039 [Aphanomyces stellatus]
MSTRMTDYNLDPNPLELPYNAARYVWAVVVYMSFVLCAVVVAMLVVGGVSHTITTNGGINLFFVNRVAGSIWVGRPLVFIRACTAIIVLSTGPLELVFQNSLSRFEDNGLSLWVILVLAGEASWFTYALNDFFLPLSGPYSSLYAPTSSILTWGAMVAWNAGSPFHASATIGRDCNVLLLGYQLTCHGGQIQIGSVGRVCAHFGVSIIATVAAYVGVRLLCLFQIVRRPPSRPVHVWLCAASDAFLSHGANDNTMDEDVQLDAMSCVMSGFIPLGNWVTVLLNPSQRKSLASVE